MSLRVRHFNPCIFAAWSAVLLGANFAFGEAILGDPQERIVKYEAVTGFSDPVMQLQERLTNGIAKLKFEGRRGYLPALLKALNIPVASQGLVFSKTSSQRAQTSPHSPRAIYFSDNVSVGWVPDGPLIDIAAIDPERGPIFYTLAQSAAGPPKFVRDHDCMRCHIGPKTMGVPGLLVESMRTASNGVPLAAVAEFVNGHNSPLEERWGGWYVTGVARVDRHLGNTMVANPEQSGLSDLSSGGNVTDLRGRFATRRYPSPHSDLIALLVLEHQIGMQNLLTRANYEARYALDELAQRATNSLGTASDWPQQRLALAAEALLEYLLYRNEAPLRGAVAGTSNFAREFARSGPQDAKGRSLRELDLQTRLARYPCSYMIYAPAFDALPLPMREYLWRRLREILTGQDRSATFAALTPGERQAVLEILRETKPEFAAWLKR